MSTRKHPDFFEQFTCIADKCPLTCCQEWKIAVDEETNQRWKKLTPPETASVQKKTLSEYTIKKDGERVIGLNAEHRCPFLSENKLCRLVTTYGDEVLSETCTVFPREVHVFESHEEETLMP
ncbi:MAG: flagellin lysine-N-methylase, partial [Lachnospiraceae bacterium]|nr:flagellin lysine-N-methylase [Lachnospiraceae bacterium]